MVRGWTPGVTPTYCRLPQKKSFETISGPDLNSFKHFSGPKNKPLRTFSHDRLLSVWFHFSNLKDCFQSENIVSNVFFSFPIHFSCFQSTISPYYIVSKTVIESYQACSHYKILFRLLWIPSETVSVVYNNFHSEVIFESVSTKNIWLNLKQMAIAFFRDIKLVLTRWHSRDKMALSMKNTLAQTNKNGWTTLISLALTM